MDKLQVIRQGDKSRVSAATLKLKRSQEELDLKEEKGECLRLHRKKT
jgi:hypothetical protein